MQDYSTFVDPTEFGVVADYLFNPDSSIEFILHAPDRSKLIEIAGQLGAALDSESAHAGVIIGLIQRKMAAGELKVSGRFSTAFAAGSQRVDAAIIPRSAPCEVIFMPPFYLAHTPGLFDGSLIRNAPKPKPRTSILELGSEVRPKIKV